MLSGFLSTSRCLPRSGSDAARPGADRHRAVDRPPRGQVGQVVRVALAGQFHALDQVVDEGAFVHRSEIRMGIEHLFQQGGAGARKTDHEDRAVRRPAGAAASSPVGHAVDHLIGHLQGLAVRLHQLRHHACVQSPAASHARSAGPAMRRTRSAGRWPQPGQTRRWRGAGRRWTSARRAGTAWRRRHEPRRAWPAQRARCSLRHGLRRVRGQSRRGCPAAAAAARLARRRAGCFVRKARPAARRCAAA